MFLTSVIIILSFVFGAAFILFLRRYDIHEKEPFYKMALATSWGGVWAAIISTLLYGIVFFAGINDLDTSFGALFVIGPVEEAAKLAALFSCYFIIRKDLNEPTDGLIYMSCVALGFSLIENYFYATETIKSGHLILSRLLICTPGHILFSALMGLAFYAVVKMKASSSLLAFSFLFAAALHGLYDLIVFNELFSLILIILLIAAYFLILSFLGYTTAKSPFRKSLSHFVEAYEKPTLEDGIECLNCGSKKPKISYKLGNIKFQKCDQCPFYLTTRDSLYYIFHHFGSTFKNLSKLYFVADPPHEDFCTLYKGNFVSDDKGTAFFNLDTLSDVLEEMNQSVIKRIENKWWFPKGLAIRRT
jgi:RsiW-degrading membrane proteinase PrsW (M82 family)